MCACVHNCLHRIIWRNHKLESLSLFSALVLAETSCNYGKTFIAVLLLNIKVFNEAFTVGYIK